MMSNNQWLDHKQALRLGTWDAKHQAEQTGATRFEDVMLGTNAWASFIGPRIPMPRLKLPVIAHPFD